MTEQLISLLSQMVIPIFSIITLWITTSTSRKSTLFGKVIEERFHVYKEFCRKGSELIVDPLLLKNDGFLTELHIMYVNVLIFCDDDIAEEIQKFISYLNKYNNEYKRKYAENNWGNIPERIGTYYDEGLIESETDINQLEYEITETIQKEKDSFDAILIAEKEKIAKMLTAIATLMRKQRKMAGVKL